MADATTTPRHGTPRRCLRCEATTAAIHGLCLDCLTADVNESRAAQGLPPDLTPTQLARIDVISRPIVRPVAS